MLENTAPLPQQLVPIAPVEAEAAVEVVAPVQKKTVLVIDDELVGLTYAHLSDAVQQLFDDRTSPEFAELWTIVMQIKGFKELLEEDTELVRKYVTSDDLVREVILSQVFKDTATELLTRPLSQFLETANSVSRLRKHLELAFCKPEYELDFSPSRPSVPKDLLKYDLLIFDLVLKKSAGAVDEIVQYLGALGKDAYPEKLPCIIIMSSRQELIDERIRFSDESHISAAGLLILPKNEVSKENFGAAGLILSYQQLERQRDIAQRMRVFMRTWVDAADSARKKASVAMWNLDAAAMQEIHLVAFNDHDPYDEHLNELIAREYLWHVESVPAIAKAVEELDVCFQEQLDVTVIPATIKKRFIAPFVQPQHGRNLVSHFTWTGFPVPPALSSVSREEAAKKFNKLVPFGALLAPKNLTAETECLIHITQQCDLNQKKPGQSVQFAVALPIEVQDYKIPIHNSKDLVARGLKIDGKEYDFKLAEGRQLALPVAKFIDYAAGDGLSVVGRLRHDIASHFLLATANHMTRWASQKVQHVEVKDVGLHLHGAKFPDGRLTLIDPATSNALSVQVATINKLVYFQDDTSMHVALWVAQEVKKYYNIDIDLAITCNRLSVGLRTGQCLVKLVDLRMEGVKAVDFKTKLAADKAPSERVNLVVVFDPDIVT